jgi:hypothetical protein
MASAAAVGLGKDEVADEAASVAHVEGPRPAAVVGELVRGQSPLLPVGADRGGHRRVVGQKPIQPADVVERGAEHFGPLGVTGDGVAVIESGEVAREHVPRAHALAVGHGGDEAFERAARGEVAALEFVVRRVVIRRLLDRPAIRRPRQAEPEAVALDAVVGVALPPRRRGLNAVDQSAGRVAGPHVGVDRPVDLRVPAVEPQAVFRLLIAGVALAADGEAQAGERQQVAFVGGVDEHPSLDDGAILTGDRGDPAVLHRDAVPFAEPVAAQHLDARLLDPFIEDGLGDVGLEPPEVRVLSAPGHQGVELRLPAVSRSDATVELQREPADGRAVVDSSVIVDVRIAEPLRGHAPEMLPGLDEDDLLPHLRRLHRGHDPGARAAVDHDVCLVRLSRGQERQQEEQGSPEHGGDNR